MIAANNGILARHDNRFLLMCTDMLQKVDMSEISKHASYENKKDSGVTDRLARNYKNMIRNVVTSHSLLELNSIISF